MDARGGPQCLAQCNIELMPKKKISSSSRRRDLNRLGTTIQK